MTELVRLIESSSRPVIVVGSTRTGDRWGRCLDEVARRIGAPIIAEATSQLRFGNTSEAVVAGDVIMSNTELAGRLRPDLVIRLGLPAIDWPVIRWLDGLDAHRVIVSERRDCDPGASAEMIFISDESAFLDALRRRLPDSDVPSAWRRSFADLGHRACEYLAQQLETAPLVDATVAHDVARLTPGGGAVVLSSSMPLREFEAFALPRTEPLKVVCNRGLNGIDGVLSTAFGVAVAHDGPTVLLIGDVALAHDIGALQLAGRLGADLTVVVVDNGGGAIFDHLPVAGIEPMFTRHFTTETSLDWSGAAALFGVKVSAVSERTDLQDALQASFNEPGTKMIVARTVREDARHFRDGTLRGFGS